MSDATARAAQFASTLGITDPAVLTAFQAVPRQLFLPKVEPERVYQDDAVPTRFAAGRATSSSTQPSLMARMIELLELRPGARVLEIGVGTGYNAAVMAQVTGAPVVSVDVQPEVVAEARANLASGDFHLVRAEHADGYDGFPTGGPYDRVIVTCGIRGIPPGWLDQLTGDGFVLAPVAHAGLHPLVRVSRAADLALVFSRSGFMHAAGRLYPTLPDDFPPAVEDCPQATVTVDDPRGGPDGEFWFTAGALDRRTTRVVQRGDGWGPGLVEGGDVAWVTGRTVCSTGRLHEDLLALLDRWDDLGQPPATAWSTTLRPVAGLLVAGPWTYAGAPY